MSAISAGWIPGVKPGADQFAALETQVSNLANSGTERSTQAQSLASQISELSARADSLRADRTRTVTDLRAVRGEIEALQADVSALQRARVASLADTPSELTTADTPPDLSAIEARLSALEDALVTQLGTYDTSLESLKLRVAELEDKASAEGLTAAASSNSRTEAALALSAIEAAARRGRPFIAAYEKLETAMPSNSAVQNLAPIATKAVPTVSDLKATYPALMDRALDLEAQTMPGNSSWMRSLFGDGIQVRRADAVTARDHLLLAQSDLEAGDLSETLEHLEAIDSNLQPVFTDWVQSAQDRHMLEETLEALRLTMIAEERP
ncbi:MAG: hypothetical protein AAGL11_12440 [Pseudomonadota bacterium]